MNVATPKKAGVGGKIRLTQYARPSASNAEAFVKCGASHILPQSDRGGEHRDQGSEAHEILGAFINGRVPASTVRGVAAVRDFDIGSYLNRVMKETRRAETAYAVNVQTRTVRFLGVDLGRNYGVLQQYEIPCTIDVEGRVIDNPDRPFLRDWKFGTHSSWMQILVQCMALAYPAEPDGEPAIEVDAGIVYIDPASSGGFHTEEHAIVSLEQIDEACDAIFNAWKRIEVLADAYQQTGKKPPTAIGPWCKYCKAFPSCPAQMSMVGALIGKLGAMEENIPEYTPEDFGVAWANLRNAKQALERIEDAIKGAAIRFPVPLPTGKFLHMIECSGRASVDREAAWELVKRLGGTADDFDKCIKRGRPYMTAKEMKKA